MNKLSANTTVRTSPQLVPFHWKKGQSGNPSGMTKIERAVVQAAQGDSLKLVQIASKIAQDESQPVMARVACINIVLDRAFGKPKERKEIDQSVDITARRARQLAVEHLTDEQLAVLESAIHATILKTEQEPVEIEGEAVEVES